MNKLRKQILKELKFLLNEQLLKTGLGEEEALTKRIAQAAKSLNAPAELQKLVGNAVKDEIGALKAANKDATALEKVLTQVGGIRDGQDALAALADARSASRSAGVAKAAAEDVKTAAVAGKETKAATAAATAAGTEAKAAEEISSLSPKRIEELSTVADKDLRSMKEVGAISEEDFELAMKAKAELKEVPAASRWQKAKDFLARNVDKCRKNKKWCATILVGAGITGYSLYRLGFSKDDVPGGGGVSPTPSPTPTPSDGGGGWSRRGLSFKCPNDTDNNSVVAKFQRYIGAFPDGKFGKNTYNKAVDFGVEIPSAWYIYKRDPDGVSKLCGWLNQTNQPWADKNGKVRKGSKPKVLQPPEPGPIPSPSQKERVDPYSAEDEEPVRRGGGTASYSGSSARPSGPSVEILGRPGEEFSPDNIRESWQKKQNKKYSNNLFERLVKSMSKKG